MPKVLRSLLLALTICLLAGASLAEMPTTTPTKKSGLQLVKMDPLTKRQDLVWPYPIAQDILTKIDLNDGKTRDKTQISYGLVKDQKNKSKILILQTTGKSYCGSTGCATHLYLDTGKRDGMQPAMNVTAGGKIYTFDNNGAISLVFCTSRGTAVWELKEDGFVLKGALGEPPACY